MSAPPDRCDPAALGILRLTQEEYDRAIAAAEARGLRIAAEYVKDNFEKAALHSAAQCWSAAILALIDSKAALPAPPPADGGDK